uniref:Wall-associated receptor kinase galacturonan-binding domain-containing protein n=1 Tax=Leersia perrieri TaxID=77586 RepID=A0A0D9UWI8_9ORYZ
MALTCFIAFHWLPLMLATAAMGVEDGAACMVSKKCGSLTISSLFWIIDNQTDRPCGALNFQVDCNISIGVATLRSSTDAGFQIMDISYGDRTLFALDVHKLLCLKSHNDCRILVWNTSVKLVISFRISTANRNLTFYNCMETLVVWQREQLGLVETRCRGNTFNRMGGQSYDGDGYTLEKCNSALLPMSTSLTAKRTPPATRSSLLMASS